MAGPDPSTSLRTWARAVVAAGAAAGLTDDPIAIVAAVVTAVARALPGRTRLPADVVAGWVGSGHEDLVATLPDPPGGWADPWLPGAVHEQAITDARRSARGAWYTPRPVVRGLVALATSDGRPPASATDPTCGGGAFLLAVLDRYRELGLPPEEALGRVAGSDIDAGAVRTTRWSLQLWAAANGVAADPDRFAVRVADVLDPLARPTPPTEGPGIDAPVVDALGCDDADGAGPLVIGNPPFATPLRSGRLPEAAEAIRSANRDLLGPYSDLAAVHLLAAIRSAGPGSTIALVLPQSVLAGRDTRGLREHCHRHAPLQSLWATRTAVFDAGVRACAVVLRPGGRPPASVTLAAGPMVVPVDRADRPVEDPGGWAAHAARALGAPPVPATVSTPSAGTIGDLATATAGFRDEYYGLVSACREWDGGAGEEPNRLVTVGWVDPLDLAWGRRPCRLGGRSWRRPVVDTAELDGRVGRWVEQRLVPKVVLATQSRVLEPVVDRRGRLVPLTPLISVAAPAEELDRLAAVLLAPPVVAWAWQRWFGASLSVDALKLAARQVLELPLPADRAAWDEAAGLIAEAGGGSDGPTGAETASSPAAVAARVARIMNRAYGADPEVLDWWVDRTGRGRAPSRPRPPTGSAAGGPG